MERLDTSQDKFRTWGERLLDALRTGDVAAREEALRDATKYLWSVARGWCSDDNDADDAAQISLLVLLKKLRNTPPTGGFETGRDVGAFLRTTCIRRASNIVTRRRKHDSMDGSQSSEGNSQSAAIPVADHRPGPTVSAAKREDGRRLFQLLDQLPREQRAVVVLRKIDELEFQQIADVLGMPLGTVSGHWKRALKRLKPMLLAAGIEAPSGQEMPKRTSKKNESQHAGSCPDP